MGLRPLRPARRPNSIGPDDVRARRSPRLRQNTITPEAPYLKDRVIYQRTGPTAAGGSIDHGAPTLPRINRQGRPPDGGDGDPDVTPGRRAQAPKRGWQVCTEQVGASRPIRSAAVDIAKRACRLLSLGAADPIL